MSHELQHSAQRAADDINKYEIALDEAMIAAARALEAQISARRVGQFNIRIGQPAVETFLESTALLGQAMRAVITSHRAWDRIAPSVGVHIAGGGKTPLPDPGHGFDPDNRYPQPPLAAEEVASDLRH